MLAAKRRPINSIHARTMATHRQQATVLQKVPAGVHAQRCQELHTEDRAKRNGQGKSGGGSRQLGSQIALALAAKAQAKQQR